MIRNNLGSLSSFRERENISQYCSTLYQIIKQYRLKSSVIYPEIWRCEQISPILREMWSDLQIAGYVTLLRLKLKSFDLMNTNHKLELLSCYFVINLVSHTFFLHSSLKCKLHQPFFFCLSSKFFLFIITKVNKI